MTGYIDLHCHWVPNIDDGARNIEEGIEILRHLRELGFEQVMATPHMRSGLFENTRESIECAYQAAVSAIDQTADLPSVGLGTEHYFDDIVFQRLLEGEGLPYSGSRGILLEFHDMDFPFTIDHRLADLTRRGWLPVIAHPERYRPIQRSPEILERLLDLGAAALLDTASLDGKYGRNPQRTARSLLDQGYYTAACSDAHRPSDVTSVARGMAVIARTHGNGAIDELFCRGPRMLLEGRPT